MAAGVLSLANLVALIVGYDSHEGRKTASSLLGTVILAWWRWACGTRATGRCSGCRRCWP